MAIHAGLVGLPNVGKSTLFNALTKSSVPAENYPFCTINPYTAQAAVPDARLNHLAQIFNSSKIIPTTISFVDIAGLVKGAARGEGLGNQFLGTICNVDVIIHVVRLFDQEKTESALYDLDIIMTELMLKDSESIANRQEKITQQYKNANISSFDKKTLLTEQTALKDIIKAIDQQDFDSARTTYKKTTCPMIPLLCTKPFIIVANVDENALLEKTYATTTAYQTLLKKYSPEIIIPLSAQLEQELSSLEETSLQEMLVSFGMHTSALHSVIKMSYDILNLLSFFTAGPKESRAWTVKKNTTIRTAAGKIHSDMERGFICADIYHYNDIAHYTSEKALKEHGKIRTEGAHYKLCDGDVVHIKFNV